MQKWTCRKVALVVMDSPSSGHPITTTPPAERKKERERERERERVCVCVRQNVKVTRDTDKIEIERQCMCQSDQKGREKQTSKGVGREKYPKINK